MLCCLLAGVEGFEPSILTSKASALTAWLYPYLIYLRIRSMLFAAASILFLPAGLAECTRILGGV